ncbi:choice-of-anchor Q domain-containing protein [Thiolapillus sp.]|uniref:choice-of-anchor Q domain-containing protein n=2 Tax=Thiolapillus sp. TaxID=2017437 RepID=UPI003AF7711C
MKRIAIIAVMTISGTANAITVHRVTSLADHGNGTLRAAIAAATSGDRITFAPWLHKKTIYLDNEIIINKEITIEGDIDDDRRPDIRLDGHGVTRILNVHESGILTLKSLILENGSADSGGAIYNNGSLQINYSLLVKNHATFGGAIFNRQNLTIYKTTLTENTASDSGGAIVSKPTDPRNRKSTVNTTVYKSTLSYNWARKQGGAIKNHGNLTIKTSTLSHNRARSSETSSSQYNRGSAVWTYANPYGHGNNTEIYDSTFVGNQSREVTSPERTEGSGPERLASRTSNGGTIYIENAIQHPIETHASIKIERTVIANSIGRNCGGAAAINAKNLWSDDNTCGGLGVSDRAGINRGDPKLISLDNNGGYTLTHMPMPGSGLLGEGGQDCEYTDQRDVIRRRITGSQLTLSHCDIGSIQHGKPTSRTPSPQNIDKNVPDKYNEDPNRLKSKIAEKEAEVTAKQADISAKAETITAQQADISAKAKTITAQQADISAKAETITAQQADISAKTETITALKTQMQTLNAELATVRTNMTNKDGNIAQLQTQAAELERKITEHQARIAELEAPDELEATIGDAGEIKRLVLNGQNTLHESETTVKIGPTTIRLKNTVRQHIHKRKDGTTVSNGKIFGQNGAIHWEITTVTIPGTNWHASRWEFSSAQAFGDVALGIYADIDILPHTGFNGLIAGGEGHPNRLLITDRQNPSEGIALGIRALKNARMLGWVGSPDIYHGRNGEVLDESILTGAYSGWGSFRPDGDKYPGGAGYGPADIAVAIGIELKPSAKLATFTLTVVGAPTGAIE